MNRMSAYHSAAHVSSSSNGLGKVITGTAALEANSGRIDELLVAAQAAGVVKSARTRISGG